MMKRAIGVLAIATVTVLTTAAAALAQTSSYPVSPSSPTTVVKGASGTAGGGTAFTGSSQIPVGTLMVVGFVVVGLAALLVARRRAARFAA
jgi:Zn-dependent alcohol dehydrogenase